MTVIVVLWSPLSYCVFLLNLLCVTVFVGLNECLLQGPPAHLDGALGADDKGLGGQIGLYGGRDGGDAALGVHQ